MNLSVRQRIGVAMTAVVLVNVVAGAASWLLASRASSHEAAAARASVRTEWLSGLAGRISAFVAEASDLAFSVSAGLSEESSAEYGDLVGADAAVKRALAGAPADLDDALVTELAAKWEGLRPDVFIWINAEAERAGAPLRLTLTDDKVRAGTSTSIEASGAVAGLDASAIRRAVRAEAESLVAGTLRTALKDASADAREAEAAANEARSLATVLTVAAIAASFLVALTSAVWLYRTIAGPLGAARDIAERVTSGDYGATFGQHAEDEVGALIHAVEQMRDSVVGQLGIMREMAGAVIITAEGIAMGTASIRERSKGVDATLVEAVACVEADAALLQSLAGQMLES